MKSLQAVRFRGGWMLFCDLVSGCISGWIGLRYCEVEKRKKGEVSLKAATDCRARAAAHNLRVAIVDELWCGYGLQIELL